jgi:hypothetical protein
VPRGWPLTGRVEELSRISELVRRRDGPAGVVLAGPVEVGKTRLAREALAAAQQRGALTRWAQPRRDVLRVAAVTRQRVI